MLTIPTVKTLQKSISGLSKPRAEIVRAAMEWLIYGKVSRKLADFVDRRYEELRFRSDLLRRDDLFEDSAVRIAMNIIVSAMGENIAAGVTQVGGGGKNPYVYVHLRGARYERDPKPTVVYDWAPETWRIASPREMADRYYRRSW